MPSIFIISAGMISALDQSGDPTDLGSASQGDGSHLSSMTISATAIFSEVEINDTGGRSDFLEDSQSGQTLASNVLIDGVRYRRGTEVENEYQITLQDSAGKTYTAWAIEIEDGDGSSYENVVGYAFAGGEVPPFGETLIVIDSTDLFNLPDNNLQEFQYENGVTCFTSGTLVDTPQGPVPVEELRCGMKVWTLDNGPQEIIWTGRQDLGPRDLIKAPHLKPILVQPGALGNSRALCVSPQHRLAVANRLQSAGAEVGHFARATLLTDHPGTRIRQARGCRRVSYVHFMCEGHQIVRSEGMLSETFYPGAQALKALHPAARAEIFALFPTLGVYSNTDCAVPQCYGTLARKEVTRRDLKALTMAA